LVPELLTRNYQVTVIDTFQTGENTLAACCSSDAFEPVRGDVRNEALMKSLVAKADVILPLAALVGAPMCARDEVGALSVNRDAIRMILKHLSRGQRLVFPTTNSGYGIGQPGKACTEETPLKPISLYGSTKVEAEQAVLDAGNGITLRLATVFGMAPRMRIDLLVNDFTYRAVNDRTVVVFEGYFKRNYIHVRDVTSAFLHVLDNYERMNNQPFNVGLSNANLSKIELCEKIKQHVPSFVYMEAPVGEDPDKRNYIVSNAKIEATGFKARYSLDDGIRELIKGYTMIRNTRYGNV
jgi:nucleoside-diphosphate-sugar epimerase